MESEDVALLVLCSSAPLSPLHKIARLPHLDIAAGQFATLLTQPTDSPDKLYRHILDFNATWLHGYIKFLS